MKKFFLILSAVALVLLLASCGGSGNGDNTGDDADSGSSGADTDSGSTGDNTDSGSTSDTDTGVVSETCGNRETDAGEVCDGNAAECVSIDPGYTGGYAVCKPNCLGWDVSACQGTPTNPVEPTDPTDSTDPEDDNGTGSTGDNSDPRDGADVTYIHLNGVSITVDGANPGNVAVSGSNATITASGVFEIDGTLSNGRIIVETADSDKGVVHVVLNAANITSSNNSPFTVMTAKDVRIFTADGTQNTLTDGTRAATTDPTAVLYSKSDLILAGEGTLTINATYQDGISSKDDLDIDGGTLVVTAKDDGIIGKDSVVIRGGDITVNSTGDGIKSDNTEALTLAEGTEDPYDGVKGYIKIKGGKVTVNAANGDGIHAISYVEIKDNPVIDITTGGGSVLTTSTQQYDSKNNPSLKGIKASVPDTVTDAENLNLNVAIVKILGGTIKVNARDDGIHSGNIYIKGGDTTVASDDQGLHADNKLDILAGTLNVTMSFEGMQGWYITVTGGVTAVYGRDDGWNAAGGNDSSGSSGWGGPGQGGPGGNGSTGYLTISGGFHYIKTGSGDTDGIDSNGTLTINGGVIVVECQINGGMGGSFDSDGSASITTQTALGFSTGKSEQGTNYSMSFNTSSYYGNANIAFKPTISGTAGSGSGGGGFPGGGGPGGGQSGSYIQSFTGQPSVITDLSGYNVQPFPNGLEVYYK